MLSPSTAEQRALFEGADPRLSRASTMLSPSTTEQCALFEGADSRLSGATVAHTDVFDDFAKLGARPKLITCCSWCCDISERAKSGLRARLGLCCAAHACCERGVVVVLNVVVIGLRAKVPL